MTTAEQIDALLPQTQCTRCGFADCHSYAQAIAANHTKINRCPPGGQEGIVRLATLTGQPIEPLDAECGQEVARQVAVIDETWCIGCTLCLDACPVDAIVGASKWMHTVIPKDCTGCELCVPSCPVDCIDMQPLQNEGPPPTGWAAWSQAQAHRAKQRYDARRERLSGHSEVSAPPQEAPPSPAPSLSPSSCSSSSQKQTLIEAVLARARSRRSAR
jgi:electron transport complex protein RnfB